MSWYPRAETVPVAHRGFSSRAPENTLVAYRQALDVGVTHVECDVHASAEGTPYVIHDPDVSRTTNGQGLVASLNDAELDRLDAGGWKAAAFAGEPVPKLTSLLELLSGKACLALEVKALGMEQAVLSALHATGFPLKALTLFCFDFDTLVRFRQLEPTLHCTFLVDRVADDSDWTARVARTRDAGIAAIGPGNETVNAHRVEVAQAAGLSVFVWTVDDPARMRALSALGVDAVISNDAALAKRTLNENG